MRQATRRTRKSLEFTLWLIVFCTFLFGEFLFRRFEAHLSGNISHIKELPDNFRTIVQNPSPRVAFIGNSLINEGIDRPLFESTSGLYSLKVVPDGTALWDWRCLINKHVLSQDVTPIDIAIIGFAWNQLTDQYQPNPSSLGGYMCQGKELLSPASVGLKTFDQVTEFLMAYSLKLYANRDTIRNRILDVLIPYFRTFAQKTNTIRKNDNYISESPTITYNRLENLVLNLRDKDVEVIIISMPVRKMYDIPDQLKILLDDLNVPFFDYRIVKDIDNSSFHDEMHLNASGQNLLTKELSEKLQLLIKE